MQKGSIGSMKSKLREKAIKLRTEEELSYSAIRKRLNVPKSTLSYWLREYPLSEERILALRRKGWQKGEASRERYRNTMRRRQEDRERKSYSKQKNKLANISKRESYVAGLMLYWGEGSKKDRYKISIANTDPAILTYFIQWLEDHLFVSRGRLRAQLHLYENMAIEKERKFWENTLGLKREQFYKPQIRRLQKNSFSYRGSHRHGTCQVSFSDREKKMELMMAIQVFVDLHLRKKYMRP